MRARFLAPLIAATLLFLPVTSYADIPHVAVAAMTASTVIVHGSIAYADEATDAGEQGVDYCSGVAVGTDDVFLLIVTAKHCATYGPDGITLSSRTTTDAKPTSVRFRDGETAKVERIVVATTSDLALLYVRVYDHLTAYRATRLDIGESVYVYGMPFGFSWTLSEGYVAQGRSETARTLLPDDPRYLDGHLSPQHYDDLMAVCGGCGPGDSGAGVWDSSGHLVGIVSAGASAYFLFVPARKIYALMSGIDPGAPPHNSMIDTPGAVDWVTP